MLHLNKDTLKTIRKYATLRSLQYKRWKNTFKKLPEESRQGLLDEMRQYIEKVENGLITPSRLLLPK